MAVLNGLGSEFNLFTVAISTIGRKESFTFSELQGMLLSHEALLSSQSSTAFLPSRSTPQAFMTRPTGPRPRFNNNRNPNRFRPRPVMHSNSSNFAPSGPRPTGPNPGVLIPPRSQGPSSFSQQSSSVNSSGSTRRPPAPKMDATCQICSRYGHIAKHCWYRFEQDSPTYQAFVAQPFTPTHGENEWVLDTGATNHVTGDINNLSNFYEYNGTDSLQIGNGSGLSILHIGSSFFSLNGTTLALHDILHVPSFSKNLISLSRLLLDNPHLTFEFFSSSCLLKDHRTKTILLQVPTTEGLYTISPHSSHSPQALLGTRTSLDEWHDRLGHPSQNITLDVVKKFSLPCNSKKMNLCHSCCMAKAHKLPFTPSLSFSSSPLELVHSDVWGPSPVTSFNGFRYYIIFVDDFTRFTWIYFMNHKSEVVRIFASFKAQVENLLSTTIKTLRSDDGTEYKPILSQFPQITHQTSCPYTPQQNGLAERKHRHIVELSLSMMTRASIPTKFWDEMFSNAVYLINRLPSFHSQIPYTSLFYKQPNYTSLRIIGCLCFPLTRPYNANKLEARALPCVFLGYVLSQKGYKCLHLPTNRLYISRHVQFDETQFPFHTSPDSEAPDFTSDFFNSSLTLLPSHTLHRSTATVDIPGASIPSLTSVEQPNPTNAPPGLLPSTCSQPLGPARAHSPLPPTCILHSSSTQSSTPDNFLSSPSDSTGTVLPDSALNGSGTATASDSPPVPIHPMVTRSRDNTRPTRKFPDFVALSSSVAVTEPTTFKQTYGIPEWRSAMATEIDALATNQTWKLVPPSSEQHII